MTTLNTNFNKEYATALQELADSEARVSSKLEGTGTLTLHNYKKEVFSLPKQSSKFRSSFMGILKREDPSYITNFTDNLI